LSAGQPITDRLHHRRLEGSTAMGMRRDGEDIRRDGESPRRAGDGFSGRLPGTGGDFIDETDVEGHLRRLSNEPEGEELYRNLPTTQGEVIRRGSGDNPHGDR
jgi:hypothetical protein